MILKGEKSVPVPRCRPQSSHGLTWDQTLAFEVTGREVGD